MIRLFSDLLERVYFTKIANYHGEKITEGPPAAVRADPRVIAALLGRADRGSDDAGA